jgi:hypothetical protein
MRCARPCADLGRGFGVLDEQKLAADRAERRAKRHLAESLDTLRAELLEPNLTAKEADRRITILKAEIELTNSF